MLLISPSYELFSLDPATNAPYRYIIYIDLTCKHIRHPKETLLLLPTTMKSLSVSFGPRPDSTRFVPPSAPCFVMRVGSPPPPSLLPPASCRVAPSALRHDNMFQHTCFPYPAKPTVSTKTSPLKSPLFANLSEAL